MNDLISRKALLAKLNAEYDHRKKPSEPEEGIELAIEIVREAETIDAEPVRRGKWELVQVGVGTRVEAYHGCSACDCVFKSPSHYCQNCGAKMDGTEK
nr:MAG TPA: Rubredoxin-like zinc ribbon domain protein [Caudoviricetes sp.]